MGRYGQMTRVPWATWITAALCVGYTVAVLKGVPFVLALPIFCVATAVEVFCLVPEEFVAMRTRYYAVAGTVVLAGLAFAVTGGNPAAGVVTLTIALNVVAFAIMVVGMKARWDLARSRPSRTHA